jgi:hypothetical protein
MKKILSLFILTALSILFVQNASAQLLTNTDALEEMTNLTATTANLGDMDIGVLVAGIIKVALGLLGIIFIILIIVSGFRWMMAGGNEEQIKKAQTIIKNAVVGLIIVMAAYAITYFVFKYIPFGGGSTMPRAI